MDPRTGEILAMANVPKVKDNVFGRKPAADRNRCVTDVYEPGSIFKLVTISGALADGLVDARHQVHAAAVAHALRPHHQRVARRAAP